MRTILRSVLAAALAAMTACGGGGDGEGSSLTGGGGLTVSPASLTFAYVPGGFTPPAQDLNGSWTADGIVAFGAALPANVSIPSWLGSSGGGWISSRNGSVPISVNPTGLAVGTYSVTLLVGISNANAVVGYREVPVTLAVKQFGTAFPSVWLMGVAGSSTSSTIYTVTVLAVTPTNWTVAADQPWIRLSETSGTTPGSFVVRYDASSLAAGTHQATLTLTPAGGPAERIPVSLSLSAAP